ncbi:MAG: hypothetical protein LBC41_13500, partial [Clostridiales bacterium]|nr:hypothetical protein [Clostridiales bacterium]
HPFAKQEFVTLQQLAQSKIIMTEAEKEHEKYIIMLFRYHDLYLDDLIYTQQIDTLVMTMKETKGIYISCDSLDTLSPGNIKLVAISSSDFNVDLCYVSRKDNCNPYVLSMLECCDANVNDKNYTN